MLLNTEVKYLYNHLNAAAICLRTSATQFSATTSISTLEPITGRKSETAIPRNIDGSRIGKTVRRSRYCGQFTLSTQLIKPNYLVILPPTQHSFFRNLPPLFICHVVGARSRGCPNHPRKKDGGCTSHHNTLRA